MAGFARRQFVIAAGAFLAQPVAVAQSRKIYRVGWLPAGPKPERDVQLDAFLEGMRGLGYVEGRNLAVERKYSEPGLPFQKLMARMQELTEELARLPVDAILAANTIAAEAARGATRRIPIVMGAAANPVTAGLLQSLSRPGGNVTGLTLDTAEITAKRLELLRETIPDLRRIGAVHPAQGAQYPVVARWLDDCAKAAAALGLSAVPLDLPVAIERWEEAFSAIAASAVGAVTVVESPTYFRLRVQLAEQCVKYRLPAMAFTPEHVAAGCFLAYGAETADMFRRAAGYMDQIFKGADPATLPVQLPNRFVFGVNLRTARLIGITVPAQVLLRADQVLE
jgi:putative ABC transport system substrate-binding protein